MNIRKRSLTFPVVVLLVVLVLTSIIAVHQVINTYSFVSSIVDNENDVAISKTAKLVGDDNHDGISNDEDKEQKQSTNNVDQEHQQPNNNVDQEQQHPNKDADQEQQRPNKDFDQEHQQTNQDVDQEQQQSTNKDVDQEQQQPNKDVDQEQQQLSNDVDQKQQQQLQKMEQNTEFLKSLNLKLIPETPDVQALARVQNAPSSDYTKFQDCQPTAHIQFILSSLNESNNHNDIINKNANVIIFQTLNADGAPKSIGGDEFYIIYKDDNDPNLESTTHEGEAVGRITDLQNGQYQVEFHQPIMKLNNPKGTFSRKGKGRLLVFFQYTCNMGRLTRPTKSLWKTSGTYQPVLYIQNDVVEPFIHTFIPENNVDLSLHERVICFGDSIINNFCGVYFDKFRYKAPNIECAGNLGMEYSSNTADDLWKKLKEWHHESLSLEGVSSISNTTSDKVSKTAIILGSMVWDLLEPRFESDIQGDDFEDHIQTCQNFIQKIRESYPHVTIYWKSPQALHVQNLKSDCFTNANCNHRVKYMSSSLAEFIYHRQKEMAKALGLTFLDVYEASYGSFAWLMDGDGRHYRIWVNKRMLEMYYPPDFISGP